MFLMQRVWTVVKTAVKKLNLLYAKELKSNRSGKVVKSTIAQLDRSVSLR